MKNLDYKELLNYAEDLKYTLKKLGVRVDVDSRQVQMIIVRNSNDYFFI